MGGISPVSTPHARSSPTSLALVEHLSGDRLSTYLAARDDNLDAAVVLYAWNGEVTGAFWEHLGHVEVSLRNTLDARLAARHDRLRRADTWLDDPARELTERARKDIATARSRVKAGKRGSHGQVLSKLSFGFWRFLVSKTCSGRFWPDLASGFPHAPNRSLTTIETPVRELWVGQRSCPHLCGGLYPRGAPRGPADAEEDPGSAAVGARELGVADAGTGARCSALARQGREHLGDLLGDGVHGVVVARGLGIHRSADAGEPGHEGVHRCVDLGVGLRRGVARQMMAEMHGDLLVDRGPGDDHITAGGGQGRPPRSGAGVGGPAQALGEDGPTRSPCDGAGSQARAQPSPRPRGRRNGRVRVVVVAPRPRTRTTNPATGHRRSSGPGPYAGAAGTRCRTAAPVPGGPPLDEGAAMNTSDHGDDRDRRAGGAPDGHERGAGVSTAGARTAWVEALVAREPAGRGGAAGTADRLQRLCRAAARALPAAGAGVSVMTEAGAHGTAAASDRASTLMEDLQFTVGEGPCLEAYASRRPVLAGDPAAMARWPGYGPAAGEHGVRAVFAFPLHVGAARLGVMDVYRHAAGALSHDALAQALTFAEVAAGILLDGQELAGAGDAADGALGHRYELHQAQGMVTVQLGVPLAEAMARLRAHAFTHDRLLHDVARDVLAHRLILDHDTP